MKFRSEPAVLIAVVQAVLAFLVTFQFDQLSAAQSANILAVAVALGGFYTAWTTQHTVLAALSGVGRALLVLAVSYGLNLSQEQIGLAVILVESIGGLVLRDRTSPAPTPVSGPA